jgi:hypothetical protein
VHEGCVSTNDLWGDKERAGTTAGASAAPLIEKPPSKLPLVITQLLTDSLGSQT